MHYSLYNWIGEYEITKLKKKKNKKMLGGNRLVRRSGITSRGTVVLVYRLRMRRFPLTLVLTIFVGMK